MVIGMKIRGRNEDGHQSMPAYTVNSKLASVFIMRLPSCQSLQSAACPAFTNSDLLAAARVAESGMA